MDKLQSPIHQTRLNLRSSPSSPSLRTRQKLDCFILKLPIDILQIIKEYLPPSSLVCIRSTCLAMYNSLSPPKSMRLEELMKGLALICRDRPDCWLASTRPYFRDVQKSDMPSPLKCRPVCEGPLWPPRTVYWLERGAMMIEAKHVQLAIKYSQLKKKTRQQARYLKLLLEPYRTVFRATYTRGRLDEATELCYFQWYPKVVSGRYLTFSRRKFANKLGNLVQLDKLGCFGACMHQVTEPVRYEDFLVRQRRAMWERFMEDETHSCHQLKRLPRTHPECSDPFYECLRKAYYMKGIWFDGACPWCLTEFSVCVEKSGALVINAWRDWGDIDTYLDHNWWEQEGYDWHVGNMIKDIERNQWEIRTRYGFVGGKWFIF